MKIAVASGKGGTGKTFISTNLFYSLAKSGHSVKLVDCDAEAPDSVAFFNAALSGSFTVEQPVPEINPDVCTFCGRCQEYCTFNAIFIIPSRKIIKVMENLCHSCGACSVACSAGAIAEKPVQLGLVSDYSLDGQPLLIEAKMDIGVMSPVPVIKAAIAHAGSNGEIVLFDSPPGTSCPFIQTVARADFVILVAEPTPFGLSDLRQSAETLKKLGKPCGVVINRAGLGNDDVRLFLEEEGIPVLLEIPFDKKIAESYSKGEIVAETNPRLSEKLAGIVDEILERYGSSSHQR